MTGSVKLADYPGNMVCLSCKRCGRGQHVLKMALPDFIPLANRELIITLAMRYGMPNIFPFRIFPTTGALMSLGIDTKDLFRRAASYVDRVLRGTKPQDLPIRRPPGNKFGRRKPWVLLCRPGGSSTPTS